MSTPIHVTIFANKSGTRINRAEPMSLEEIERIIRTAPPVNDKASLPLLKLASFGVTRTPDGCLRHDANVETVCGIEADYDGESVPMEHAAETLAKHGIAGVLYTSANHTEDKPRWRVLVPLCRTLEGDTAQLQAQHRHWAGVLNALLGGIFTPESFVLSQSYYFGPITGKPEPQIIRLSGCCLDELEEIPGPVFPASEAKGEHDPGTHYDLTTDADLIAVIGCNDEVAQRLGLSRHAAMLKMSSRRASLGMAADDIESVLLQALGENPPPFASNGQDPRKAARGMAESAVRKWGESRRSPATEPARGEEAKSEDWSPPSVATYGASFDASKIPKRRWVLGRRRSIGEVTVDTGPPGTNKSTLMLTDAVAIVTGKKILADPVWETGGALYLAGEDARRDVEARLAGILQYYYIRPAQLADRLHVVYLAEIDVAKYTLAQMVADVATLNTRMLEWLRDYPDVLAVFVDPMLAWHRLIENSNEALQVLCSGLRSLAVRGGTPRRIRSPRHENHADRSGGARRQPRGYARRELDRR